MIRSLLNPFVLCAFIGAVYHPTPCRIKLLRALYRADTWRHRYYELRRR